MLRKSRISPRLFSDFDTLQFASVTGMVVFVVLLIFMIVPPGHDNISADLPRVLHPVAMRGALREDAMQVLVTRDGKIYLGSELVAPYSIAEKLRARLNDRDVERKVYIRADERARYGTVKVVLDGVRSAGILRVAFLADQRKVPNRIH